jgi:hypothetical protein
MRKIDWGGVGQISEVLGQDRRGSSLPINRYFFLFLFAAMASAPEAPGSRGWAKLDSMTASKTYTGPGIKDEAPEGGNPPGTSLAACPATTRNTMQGPRSNNSIGRRNEESPARFEPDRASRSMRCLCLVWENQAQEAYTRSRRNGARAFRPSWGRTHQCSQKRQGRVLMRVTH